MSYKGPIDIITSEMQSAVENEIYSAVKCVGVNVDKTELLKALRYDRGQYQKGYADRDSEIVRCKHCKHLSKICLPERHICNHLNKSVHEYWFCADGEMEDRKSETD